MARSLKKAEQLYFNGQVQGVPAKGEAAAMDDETYDALKDIRTIKKGRATGRNGGAAGSVGATPPEGSKKVQLPVWMGSLDKPRNIEAWLDEDASPVVAMDKLDGVSGLVVVDALGQLSRVYTRGNGSVGEDVSFMLEYAKGLPGSGAPQNALVRGEFVISKTDFAQLQDRDPALKNARATVSGVINSRRSRREDVLQRVQFVAYELVTPDQSQAQRKSRQLAQLSKVGFTTVWHKTMPFVEREALEECLATRMRDGVFDIDGLVLARDIVVPASAEADQGNPEHVVAFKMNTLLDTADAEVVDVEWKQSKDGLLKPTVRIKPVTISGVVIERLTGFNGKYITDNVIGPGARVRVVRSGLVIPYINQVLSPAPAAAQPAVAFTWTSTGVDMVATEKDDGARITELQHFLEKLGVVGVGQGTVRKLYAAGYTSFETLLSLQADDIASLPGFGALSAAKLEAAIQQAAEAADTATWLMATNWLGRGFGEKKLRALMAAYPDLEAMEESRVAAVSGFSAASAQVITPRLREFAPYMESLRKQVAENMRV